MRSERLKADRRFSRRRFRINFWVRKRNKKGLPILFIRRSNRQVTGYLSHEGRNLTSVDSKGYPGGKSERASEAGKVLGAQVVSTGIKTAVFNRSGYRVTGRVRAFLNGLRESGLTI